MYFRGINPSNHNNWLFVSYWLFPYTRHSQYFNADRVESLGTVFCLYWIRSLTMTKDITYVTDFSYCLKLCPAIDGKRAHDISVSQSQQNSCIVIHHHSFLLPTFCFCHYLLISVCMKPEYFGISGQLMVNRCDIRVHVMISSIFADTIVSGRSPFTNMIQL